MDEVGNQLAAYARGLKNLTGTLEDSLSDTGDSLSSTLRAGRGNTGVLCRSCVAIADETDRLESFVKDALQAAARLDLAGILDAYKHWDVGSIDFNGHLSRSQRPSGGHGSRHVPLGGPSDGAGKRPGDEMGDAPA